MAIASKKDRLSPPLMYVFRAANAAGDARKRAVWKEDGGAGASKPGKPVRAQQRMAITELALRREVARDLESLMNCVAMEASVDMLAFPAVRTSILNYGFPDVVHRSIDENSVDELESELEHVLKTFEPRLLKRSIRVRRDDLVSASELKIRYVIIADMSCEPLNVPLEFVADVELDSGKIVIGRL